MSVLNVSVSGIPEVNAFLETLTSPNLTRDILDEASAFLLSRIRQRFLAEVDPDGRPWVPSLASQIRKATGRGGGTLFDTGRLFHSIQLYADSDSSRLIGTDVPYAAAHQNGEGQIIRRFLGIGPDDVDPVTRLVIFRIQKALGN